ncbi:MAG: hypothetical protein DMD81_13100 [Candidatus Rokuibacteriota bacterium]|nr:MAG: hypothetical protein DMD81_13100 [Candidatus Rokubacteria bacterium]
MKFSFERYKGAGAGWIVSPYEDVKLKPR